jgi:hypothetical protein
MEKPLALRWGDRVATPNRWRLDAERCEGRGVRGHDRGMSSEYLCVQDLESGIAIQTPATDGFFAQ